MGNKHVMARIVENAECRLSRGRAHPLAQPRRSGHRRKRPRPLRQPPQGSRPRRAEPGRRPPLPDLPTPSQHSGFPRVAHPVRRPAPSRPATRLCIPSGRTPRLASAGSVPGAGERDALRAPGRSSQKECALSFSPMNDDRPTTVVCVKMLLLSKKYGQNYT